MFDLYLKECEALRTLYKRKKDLSHTLGINLEMQKKLNAALNSKTSMPRKQKQLLKNIGKRTYLLLHIVFIHICFIWKRILSRKRGFTSRD